MAPVTAAPPVAPSAEQVMASMAEVLQRFLEELEHVPEVHQPGGGWECVICPVLADARAALRLAAVYGAFHPDAFPADVREAIEAFWERGR